MASLRSGLGHRAAIGVIDCGKGGVGLIEDGGVVEFMPAECGPCGKAGYRCLQHSTAVAQVKLAFFVACDEAKETSHLVTHALFVDQRFAQRHVAPTFAVDGFGLGVGGQASAEGLCRCEGSSVQLGVAARQPDEISAWVRRFIGQG